MSGLGGGGISSKPRLRSCHCANSVMEAIFGDTSCGTYLPVTRPSSFGALLSRLCSSSSFRIWRSKSTTGLSEPGVDTDFSETTGIFKSVWLEPSFFIDDFVLEDVVSPLSTLSFFSLSKLLPLVLRLRCFARWYSKLPHVSPRYESTVCTPWVSSVFSPHAASASRVAGGILSELFVLRELLLELLRWTFRGESRSFELLLLPRLLLPLLFPFFAGEKLRDEGRLEGVVSCSGVLVASGGLLLDERKHWGGM